MERIVLWLAVAGIVVLTTAFSAVLSTVRNRRQTKEVEHSLWENNFASLSIECVKLKNELEEFKAEYEKLKAEIEETGFMERAEVEIQAEKAWANGVSNIFGYHLGVEKKGDK